MKRLSARAWLLAARALVALLVPAIKWFARAKLHILGRALAFIVRPFFTAVVRDEKRRRDARLAADVEGTGLDSELTYGARSRAAYVSMLRNYWSGVGRRKLGSLRTRRRRNRRELAAYRLAKMTPKVRAAALRGRKVFADASPAS